MKPAKPIPAARKQRYIRVSQAMEETGLTKPKIFQLIAKGLIRSANLGTSRQRRAVRLIDAESLYSFIESRMEGGQ